MIIRSYQVFLTLPVSDSALHPIRDQWLLPKASNPMGFQDDRQNITSRFDSLTDAGTMILIGLVVVLLALLLGMAICDVLTSASEILQVFVPPIF